jgi:amidase
LVAPYERVSSAPTAKDEYAVTEKSVAALETDLASGRVTSEALVRAYLARIAAIDASGPSLRSVIATNPHALDDARASDAARRAGTSHGGLAGIPVLVKDNIETSDGTATTAGSLALANNVAHRDAPLVKRLRAAGAIVLGKTNLSEWANIRSSHSISGWSAVGGLVKNPYALDRNACGSSSGTGSAIAASLAAVGVGTETDGSVTCPASMNGLVGLKPTVGLISRTHVVPISHTQDTPGPMGRSVADVAALLTGIAGSDPADVATLQADAHLHDYVSAARDGSLAGKRLGVLRYATGGSPDVDALFARAIAALKTHGATIVELKTFKPDRRLGDAEDTVLFTELKADLNAYLTTTPTTVEARTLGALIAFNRAHPRELALFGQDEFEKANLLEGLKNPAYRKARALAHRLAGPAGIDALVKTNKLDALIAPSYGPAWRTDVVAGDNSSGSVASLPAVAGYPHLTVPMGYVRTMPVGISFVGPAWSEATLLGLGAAYERATTLRHAPTYAESVETTPGIAPLLAPVHPRSERTPAS